CPYECNITSEGSVRATGDALFKAQRGRTARFEVSLNDATRGELDVLVSDPNGGPLPVRCYRQQDDSYWVEFTPEQTGTHNIEVTFGDVPVIGSPFKCEVVDPKKVRVKGLSDALLLRHATVVNVDRRQAGTGDLSVEVTDPSGAPLKVEMLKSPGGEDRATFLPNQTGPHKVNVKVAGFQIPGKLPSRASVVISCITSMPKILMEPSYFAEKRPKKPKSAQESPKTPKKAQRRRKQPRSTQKSPEAPERQNVLLHPALNF
ncbi:unnamed protein product, partial [Cylicostephanus goldi]